MTTRAAPPPAAPAHLFVYGTLRRGFPAHAVLARRAPFAGTGRIAGRLYDTGRYPAAVPSVDGEDAWVHGELFRLPADDRGALLASLDEYEGFVPGAPDRSLFRRVAVDVERPDGGRLPSWVYLFHRPVDGLVRIPSGDYADRG